MDACVRLNVIQVSLMNATTAVHLLLPLPQYPAQWRLVAPDFQNVGLARDRQWFGDVQASVAKLMLPP